METEISTLLKEQENRGLPIWEQLPGEPDTAFATYCEYRNLGCTRSFMALAAARGAARPGGNIAVLSLKFAWPLRASAYDEHCAVDQERLVQLSSPSLWAERAAAARRDKYEMGTELHNIVQDRFDRHFGRVRNADGTISEETIKPEPLSLNVRDLVSLARLAHNLADEAIEGKRGRGRPVKNEGQGEFDPDDTTINIQELSTSQLRQLQQRVRRVESRTKQ